MGHSRKDLNKRNTIEGGYIGIGNYKNQPEEAFLKKEDRNDNDPYKELGNAIIVQAYKDYIDVEFASYSYVKTRNHKIVRTLPKMGDTTVNKNEIMEFFNSDLYSLITNIDSSAIVKLAEDEIEMIRDSIKNGYIWDQFIIVNYGRMISIDKFDYNRIYRNIREKAALESRITKYEKLANREGAETSYHICKKLLPSNPMYSKDVYILINDKMNFYRWDKKKEDFYKVFNGSKILGRKSFYKKSKYYSSNHKRKE